ncbi:MAG: DUF1579 domain-containing protein [Pirellulales bacterium]|nr:DUF1579 domain-containing protein [Pirellulales bacterium]
MNRTTCLSLVTIITFSIPWIMQPTANAQGYVPEPSEHHKVLMNDVGTWDVEYKLWTTPDAEPATFKATENNRSLEGGMWIISDFTSQMGTNKFEGHGVIGYDPFKKKYVGGWVDSMNPLPSLMEGTYDAKTKTMTMVSETRNPETGDLVKSRNVTRYTGEDTRVFQMYMTENGSEWKVMEGQYTRKK